MTKKINFEFVNGPTEIKKMCYALLFIDSNSFGDKI